MTPKLLKATDVCESIGVQLYVLRSWEKEFPGIGVQKSEDSPRLYRPSDVEQVLRIKQLVFAEGLTLAGARRRLGEFAPPPANTRAAEAAEAAQMAEALETIGADARARITRVRNGLRSILDVLSRAPGSSGLPDLFELKPVSPPVERKAAASGGGRGGGRPSGSSEALAKSRPVAARGQASASKRAVAVKPGGKRKRVGA